MKRSHLLGAVCACILVVSTTTTSAASVTINFTDSGHYYFTGDHNATNKNYVVAAETSTEIYHNYFVFDMPNITGDIVSATLKVESARRVTNTPSTYTLFDVSTPIATLMNTNSGALLA